MEFRSHTQNSMYLLIPVLGLQRNTVVVDRIFMHGLNVFYPLLLNHAIMFLVSAQDIYGLSFWM
jgi:hypothetical protein